MNYIGWLAPDGSFFECDRYTHDETTSRLLVEFYNINPDDKTIFDKEDALYSCGWCRISFNIFRGHGYIIQAKWEQLTEYQKMFLRKMYDEVGNKIEEGTLRYLIDYEIIEEYNSSYLFERQLRKNTKNDE